jgi:Na+/proline symporter
MLQQSLIIGLLIVGALCLIPLIRVRGAQRSISGFFLHNENLSLGPLIGTLVASNLSLGNMVFICAIVGYFFGWSGLFWVLVTIIMLAVGFLTFGSRFKSYIEQRGNFGTVHDFIASNHAGKSEKNYNTLKHVTAIVSSLSLFLAIVIEAHLGTKFIALALRLPHIYVLGGFCFVLVAYTAHGGFQSVVWTDVLQSFLMTLAIVAGFFLFANLPPGQSFSAAGYDASLSTVIGGVGWPTAVGLSVLGFCWLVSTPDTWQRNCASRSLDTSKRGVVIGCLVMCISVMLFALAGMLVKVQVEPLVMQGARAAELSGGAFPLNDIFLLDFDALGPFAAALAAVVGIGLVMAAVSTMDTFLVVIGHVVNVDLALSRAGIRKISDLDEKQNLRIVARGRALILFFGILILVGWLLLSTLGWLSDPLNLFFVTYTIQFTLFWPVIAATYPNLRSYTSCIASVVISSALVIVIGAWGMSNLDGSTLMFGLKGPDALALLPLVPILVGAIIFGSRALGMRNSAISAS